MALQMNQDQLQHLNNLYEKYELTEEKIKEYDRGPCYAGGCSSSCYGSCKGNCQYGG